MSEHRVTIRRSSFVDRGFTLVELVLVIVIIGILATTVLRTGGALFETAKTEQTKHELDALALAMVGNSQLDNNGVRVDFGYVGDIGALPPNLDALYTNPGGYATWNGPYVANRFTQTADDFKTDAWGVTYNYSGVSLTSTGSGSNIVRRVANSTAELLLNSVSGTVTDLSGTPPGSVYCDSVEVQLFYPDGAGAVTGVTGYPDAGGYFAFDSLPIGNHRIAIVYTPTGDTLHRIVSIAPGSSPYSEYHLTSDVWYDTTGGGGIIFVPASDTLVADCHGFTFWILNTSGGPVDISSLTLSYTGLTGYYRYVKWSGATVFDENNPANGSGDLAPFTTSRTIADGESIEIMIDVFKSNPVGGAGVDVDNTAFTVTLSDGSTFEFTTGNCP
ncbi:MAG: prepilin-type N-terminal cleavage/methylation domain-containing protein [Candidatus Zixiibacteriota bacterium]